MGRGKGGATYDVTLGQNADIRINICFESREKLNHFLKTLKSCLHNGSDVKVLKRLQVSVINRRKPETARHQYVLLWILAR